MTPETLPRRSSRRGVRSPPFPKKKYRTILADPPWRHEMWLRDKSTGTHYETMALEDILRLPVKKLAEDNAVLYLWACNPMLQQGLAIMKAWGFTYRTKMEWVKNRIGLGFWVRSQDEPLLIGTRGRVHPPPEADRFSSVIHAPVRSHSEKPPELYPVLEAMSPGPRIELFARYHRVGWDVWGLEAPRWIQHTTESITLLGFADGGKEIEKNP